MTFKALIARAGSIAMATTLLFSFATAVAANTNVSSTATKPSTSQNQSYQRPNRPGNSHNRPDKPGSSKPQKPNRPGPSNPQRPNRPDPSKPQKPNKPGPSKPQRPTPTPTPVETNKYSLTIDGKKVADKPFYQKNTLMMPLRSIVEGLGGRVNYSDGKMQITYNKLTKYIEIGKNSYNINGRNVKLAYAPTIVDSKTYVPSDFLEYGLGIQIEFSRYNTINVYAKPVVNRPSKPSKPIHSKMSITINGKTSAYAPYYKDNTLMIPLRSTVVALGYSYVSNSHDRSSTFSAKHKYTTICWDDNSYPIDNRYVKLESKPEIKDGVLYVPVSFATRGLKCNVKFSDGGKKVTLTR